MNQKYDNAALQEPLRSLFAENDVRFVLIQSDKKQEPRLGKVLPILSFPKLTL